MDAFEHAASAFMIREHEHVATCVSRSARKHAGAYRACQGDVADVAVLGRSCSLQVGDEPPPPPCHQVQSGIPLHERLLHGLLLGWLQSQSRLDITVSKLVARSPPTEFMTNTSSDSYVNPAHM